MSRIDVAPDRVASNPPEPAPGPALSGGNHAAMRVVLIVIGALVALGSLVSLGVLAKGVGDIRVVTETRTLPADIRSLSIDTGDVPVAVRLITDADASEPRVDLRLVTSSDDTQLAVAEDGAGSRITLSDNGSGFLWFDRTGEIKIILPPDVAKELNVTVNQQDRPTPQPT